MFSLEYLNETKIRLEVVRADLNEELTTALQDVEQNDAGRFSRMQRSLENQLKDPADAFLQAQHREREIKEQIEELQHSLEFRKPKVRKRAGR